jgi:hypothetical protein
MKAKTKEEFIQAWKSELKEILMLSYSLPKDKFVEFWKTIEKLHKFVEIAADEAFKDKSEEKPISTNWKY